MSEKDRAILKELDAFVEEGRESQHSSSKRASLPKSLSGDKQRKQSPCLCLEERGQTYGFALLLCQSIVQRTIVTLLFCLVLI